MVIAYSMSMDQPGKVANPTCGQLNKEIDTSLSPFVHGAVVVLLLLPYAACMIYGFYRVGMRYGTAEAGCVRSIML